MNSMKNVAIIILNWNGWQDTIECLESVLQNDYCNYNIILIDNNSKDESVQKIQEYSKGEIIVKSPFFVDNTSHTIVEILEAGSKNDLEKNGLISTYPKLILIKNDKNEGFAEGNNIGIRYALDNLDSDYILLLNNDTVVEQQFLVQMLKVSESDEKIGIAGPKIYYYDEPNRIWFAKGKISWKFCRGLNTGHNEIDTGQHDQVAEVEYTSGCAFLIKKQVIEEIGLLDKKFFLYFEEIDWTLRASEIGYKSVFVPQGRVWHKVSKSGGGISGKVGLYYITRNRWLLMKRWAKKTDFMFFILYQAVGAVAIPIFLTMYYQNAELFLAYYKGLYDGLVTITTDF